MRAHFEADHRGFVLRLNQLSERIRARLTGTVGGLTGELLQRIQAAEPVRTGRLRSQIRASVRQGSNSITGTVRIAGRNRDDIRKAVALEYGARGTAQVAEHEMTLGHLWSRAIEPRQVIVAAFERRVNVAEHRFMRDPFRAMQGEIAKDLQDAVATAVEE